MTLEELKRRFDKRKKTYTLTNTVEINLPIKDVFNAITTSHIWVSCYPETLSVGGITKRPFKANDLIIERFMFAGGLFSCFQYEVDEYVSPNRITFHGEQLMTNDILERLLGPWLRNIGGTFEYQLEGDNITKWTRKLHLYYNGGFFTHLIYRIYLMRILRSQKKGAALFVNNVKRFLESPDYKKELGF